MRDPFIRNESAGSAARFAPRGTHWLIDCHGVRAALLVDTAALRTLLRGAAEAAGARILFDHFHDFANDRSSQSGVTGVVLLAESHATIHTWPETGFAAIDLFLCGASDPEKAVAFIERGLAPTKCVVSRQQRGSDE